MKVLGREITLRSLFGIEKKTVPTGLLAAGGFWQRIFDWTAGAWQADSPISTSTDIVLAYHAVFACVSLIAADIAKLRLRLLELDATGIWNEVSVPAFSPVLRKPNHFQNHIQLKEVWIISKLLHGNAYALKQRDNRGVVVALFMLDAGRVIPMVAPDGSVFYQLSQDHLSGLEESAITVPASEIIHDRMNCLFHPLVGVSPIFACGVAADQGLRIQRDSSKFFANGAKNSGVLTAPGSISDSVAVRLKAYWDDNFTGEKAGKVAVLGDGLKFEPMRMSSVDAQLIEQLKWTAEVVCSCYHVPPYKIGVGAMPSYNNIEALSQDYYSQCLQSLIESMELCLDEGLALPAQYGTELDLDGLLRMDTATQIKSLTEAIGGGLMAPNEGRKRINLKPLQGGDTVYLQQQEYSLAALDARDRNDPFAKPTPIPPAEPATAPPDVTDKALHLLFKESPELLACST